MIGPWWDNPSAHQPPSPARPEPRLLPDDRASVLQAVADRAPVYTPEWTARGDDDAGMALVRLFAEQMEPVLGLLNRLPEKAVVEALRVAGLPPLPATPATVLLEFTVLDSTSTPGSVLVEQGFQVGARPPGGAGDLIIFETQDDLYATPAKIAQRQVQEGSFFLDLGPPPDEPAPILPFGGTAEAGRALYLGLSGIAPTSQLALGIEVDAPAGLPPPVAVGGPASLPVPPAPVLAWEVYDGAAGEFVPAGVLKDETGGLVQGGVVVLRVPESWAPGRPPGLDAPPDLHWLRLRIVQGRFARPPSLLDLRLNVARALAVRTIRDEVLDFLPGSNNRRLRLAQPPVVPDSVRLTVVDSSLTGVGSSVWERTDDLALEPPDAKKFELDPGTGEITVGDGVHGAAIPPEFRNVRATYQAVSTASGGVTAKAASTLLSSSPFITGVNNPRPASGGTATEGPAEAAARGPQVLRARRRAVTTADYALLATQAPGARIVRAHALAGRHPTFPGRPIPGVVGVFAVPPDLGQGAPPIPTEEALRAVASYLSGFAAPAGVDVVAAPPRYHFVRARVAVVLEPGSRPQAVLDAIIDYLHPIRGGADGRGWPFGAPLLYTPMVLHLLGHVPGLRAVPKLALEIDGRQLDRCADFPIEDDALFWSLRHEIVPDDEGGPP